MAAGWARLTLVPGRVERRVERVERRTLVSGWARRVPPRERARGEQVSKKIKRAHTGHTIYVQGGRSARARGEGQSTDAHRTQTRWLEEEVQPHKRSAGLEQATGWTGGRSPWGRSAAKKSCTHRVHNNDTHARSARARTWWERRGHAGGGATEGRRCTSGSGQENVHTTHPPRDRNARDNGVQGVTRKRNKHNHHQRAPRNEHDGTGRAHRAGSLGAVVRRGGTTITRAVKEGMRGHKGCVRVARR
jgi:hypothetical protein